MQDRAWRLSVWRGSIPSPVTDILAFVEAAIVTGEQNQRLVLQANCLQPAYDCPKLLIGLVDHVQVSCRLRPSHSSAKECVRCVRDMCACSQEGTHCGQLICYGWFHVRIRIGLRLTL